MNAISKSELAHQLAREGKLSAKEIQRRCGFKHLSSVYRACDDAGIKPPASVRSRNFGTVSVYSRYSKRNGKNSIRAYLGVELLRGANLEKETRLRACVQGGKIIVSAMNSAKETP